MTAARTDAVALAERLERARFDTTDARCVSLTHPFVAEIDAALRRLDALEAAAQLALAHHCDGRMCGFESTGECELFCGGEWREALRAALSRP